LLVLNKADRLAPGERERLTAEYPNALLLSSRDKADVARLHASIATHFERGMAEADFVIPYALSKLVAEAHASTRVISETYEEDGTHLRVKAAPEQLAKLEAALSKH
jgi:GTP-binding protein HflX